VDGGEGEHEEPDSGPIPIIYGEKDHTVPWAIANAAYKRQKPNPAVTEIVKIPNPGPFPHDRPRMARGRPDGTRFRQALRRRQAELVGLLEGFDW
jgi:pimeloyl-ACP methyl ester carboxylesterase